jgi:glycosyltransferase involved in cell wall biosynthesis
MDDCRILALLPFLVKGALSIEILRGLSATGFDVTLAFSEDTSARYPADAMEDFVADDRLIDLTRESMPGSLGVIRQAVRARNIDLLVQVGAPLYPHLPRWKEDTPQIRIADILYNEFGHTVNHFLYERCIDGVVVESEAMREYVERASFKEDPAVKVVRSGVDLTWFKPREQRPVSDGRLTLGYIGRMSAEKNPMGFVDMAQRLLEIDPELEFRMTGDGPEATALRARLASADQHIVYRGFVEHSRTALYELDVLILPSRFDGRPAVIMEANGCGIPVIAAPVGGIPELIEEGTNGFLVHPEDTEEIHGLLSAWKASPERLVSLKASSREYASRNFDRRRMLDDYAQAFREIASA